MTGQRPPTGRSLELSALAIERLWRLAEGALIPTTYVPQADDLDLAYGLLRTRIPDALSAHDLTEAFGLHGRHAAYTLEAVTELGLLSRFSLGWFSRSALGTRVATSPEPEAYRLFIQAVLRLPVIRSVLAQVRASPNRQISRASIEHTVSTTSNRRYSRSTVGRRATSVVAWMLWLENNVWFVSPA